MKINLADVEMLSSLTEEMASYGYRYVAYPLNLPTDCDSIQFFRTSMGAEDHCLVGQYDLDHFKSMPIDSVIGDLNTLIRSGIDTSLNKEIDLTEFTRLEREKKESLENNLNTNTMNQKNLDYLKDQLKYTGFGETFESELKEKMLKGENEFKISREGVYGKDSMTSELSFKKSDQSDMYFFNSYHVNLKKENSKEGLEQTFYINKDSSSITLKEAYNLMEGRSVNKDLRNKEGEVYNAWIKLDFKESDTNTGFKLNQYHQNYGYDLEASLAKHSIKELETPKYKEDLLNSLKKGNLQSVTFVVSGVESKMFVEANPQFKTLNVYDANMQRINHRESKNEKNSQSESKSEVKDAKQTQEQDSESEPKKNARKKKSNSIH